MNVQPNKSECDAIRAKFGAKVLEDYLLMRSAMHRAFGLDGLEQHDRIAKLIHTLRHEQAPPPPKS